ncbi:cob(I)yrinic acid a,c-diamide adenosyltransferase [Echinicola jeungdonensis]|uniref:Corrinoid adenosyltransferase n=1 Tax=Echinicola jeungdonensis TaxID=709343 RepID=A0ABV5J667_9BACT|nr:cob(I)yrinic acid a,c-diamide adenosyltransferase [Echinicola jeungdonensis]MDN3669881.1 cob(I)yrinic acid a,c-diamide adenosyltransferase [Echinicola jeungdonensis]
MKVYTKSGDKGTTSLLGGERVSKGDLRIEVYGTVDELNAFLGLIRDYEESQNRKTFLKSIQDKLFTIGADLANRDKQAKNPVILEKDITELEKAIDEMEEVLPPLKKFILPGGHPLVSYCHIARTVCRRAERRVISLNEQEQVAEAIIKYLNRLSDYLFVLGRMISKELNTEEVTWEPRV